MSGQTTISSSSLSDNHECRHRDFKSSQLICLIDDDIHHNPITFLLDSLRQLVDDTKLFDDSDKCKDFLEHTSDITTFLVISNQLEESFLPQIRHMKHIWSIHICYQSASKKYQQQRTKSKMRLIHTNLERFLTDLTQTIQQEFNCEGNAIFSSQTSTTEQETTTDDSLWSTHIEFLDFLCYLPNPQNYFQRLITFLEEYYQGNHSQLTKVKDFLTNYRSENAIQWYTKDTFVYRLLNRALRQHNIEVLFLFGFLIKDIQKQLKDEHQKFKLTHNTDKNSIVKVYRGQMMSFKEIQQLTDDYRSQAWIVNNSFFSATVDRDVALRFLNTTISQLDDELRSVLFEIEVNTQIKSRPYSDISHLSQFDQENEFLFTFGNQFGKTNVFYTESEQILTVQLQLNYDYYVKDDQEFVSNNPRKMLKKCVSLLDSMTKDMSVKSTHIVFDELIILYPAEKEWILALKMGWLASKNINEKDYTAALANYTKPLSIWHKFIDDEELNCFIDIARTHENLALCYLYNIKDQTLAEKQYLEAIQYFKLALKKTTTVYERMKIYEKLTYLEKHRVKLTGYDPDGLEMILRYEELSIANMLQYYKTDSVQLGQTLRQLADLKKFQFEYDESLAHYQRALDIFLQQPFEFDFYLNISDIINEIVNIYLEEKSSDYLSAIEYELIKHQFILRHYVGTHHRNARCLTQYDLAQSHIQLAYKYMAIGKRKTAQIHLTEVLVLYHESEDEHITDYKAIRNSQLQEQLADRLVELYQYDKAYRYMKMSMKYYQHQKYMLQTNFQLKVTDNIARIKHHRECQKLEIRGRVLQDKMNGIRKLMRNPNIEKEDLSKLWFFVQSVQLSESNLFSSQDSII